MDYTIEGTKVLDNFNPATAPGGINKALVREFQVSVADGNGLQIVCSKDAGNDVFEAGIEVIGGAPTPSKPPVTVLSPNGNETYRVGDTLTVTWEWDTSITGGVAIWLSMNTGENYDIITPASVPSHATGTTRGAFKWKIAPTLNGRSTQSTQCMVRVNEYSLTQLTDESNAAFSIAASAGATGVRTGGTAERVLEVMRQGTALAFAVRSRGAHTLEVFDLSGAVRARYTGEGRATYVVGAARLGSGAYLARVRTAQHTFECPVTITAER